MNLHKKKQCVRNGSVFEHKSSSLLPKPATIMKLSTALLTFASLQVSAYSYSQQVSLSKKNSSLNRVLHEIREQSGYNLLYNSDLINSKGAVNINLKNASVEEALRQTLAGKGLGYSIKDKTVLIHELKADPTNNSLEQQQRALRGRVLSSDKQPIPGVLITVSGTNNKTQTDKDGYYNLKVFQSAPTIEASYVGYETVVKTISKDQQELNFTLIVKQNELEQVDVIVSTGYQTLPKERATGSFSFVSEDKLKLTNMAATDFAKGLEGMVPGLLVGPSGSLEIRGAASLRADTRAVLIVVDGFPVESGNFTINPNDIQNISVLKDAAASSIWGVRASNGVIVITTKSGMNTEGKAVFEVSSNLSFNTTPDFGKLNPASTSDFIDFEVETINKGWINFKNLGNKNYSPVAGLFYQKYLGNINDQELEAGLNTLKSYNSLDQKNLFYRSAVQKQLNLSIRGGSEKYKYFLSSFYTNQLTSLVGNKNDNFNFNFKNDLQILPNLNLSLGVNSTFIKNNTPNDGYSFIDNRPYLMFLDDNGNYVQHSSRIGSHLQQGYYDKGYLDWGYNPLQNMRGTDKTSETFASRIQVGAEYKIIEGLKFSSQYQTELRFINGEKLQTLDTYYARDMANLWRVYNPTKGSYDQLFPKGNIFDKDNGKQNNWTFRNTLNLDRQFGTDHTLSAIAGVELRSIFNRGNNERYYNYDPQALTSDVFNVLALSTFTQDALGGYNSYTWNPAFFSRTDKFFSAFGNAAYTYLSKYTVSGSIRTDQSNLFGTDPKYRYQPLWSVGASWNMSRENFMNNVDFVNRLIFRATYGLNGNIGNSSPYPIANTGKNFQTQENMLTFSNPENQFLRPEKTATSNIGIDFSLFNKRLNGSFDYYNRRSFDLLSRSILDATVGFGSADRNIAKMSNHGVELNLNANILSGPFNVDIDLNLGYNNNKVTDVLAPSKTATTYLSGTQPIKDMPLSYLYSYKWAGLSEKGEPRIFDAEGNIKSWKDGRITDINALAYAGTMVPPFHGGMFIHMHYKGFTLSPQFTFKAGHKMRLSTTRMDMFPRITADIANRWQKPGDEAITDIPRTYDTSSPGPVWDDYYRKSDRWIDDASFIKLRSVTLNYRLPSQWIQSVFSDVNMSFQANNFLLWSANSQGSDPDYVDLNTGSIGLPASKNYVFSLNFKF